MLLIYLYLIKANSPDRAGFVMGDLYQQETVKICTSVNTDFASTSLTPCLYSKNTYTSSQTAAIQ